MVHFLWIIKNKLKILSSLEFKFWKEWQQRADGLKTEDWKGICIVQKMASWQNVMPTPLLPAPPKTYYYLFLFSQHSWTCSLSHLAIFIFPATTKKMVCRAVQILIMALFVSGLTYASKVPTAAPTANPIHSSAPTFVPTHTEQPTTVAVVIIIPTTAPTSHIKVASSSVITLAVIASIIGLIACCSGCYMFAFPAKGKDASGT